MFIFVVQVAVDIFTIGEYRPAAVKLPLLLHGTGNLPVVPDALLLLITGTRHTTAAYYWCW